MQILANSSLRAAYQHFSGIRAILQWRGITGLTSQSSRAILYEYRPIDVSKYFWTGLYGLLVVLQ
jgi:hypothetical protein